MFKLNRMLVAPLVLSGLLLGPIAANALEPFAELKLESAYIGKEKIDTRGILFKSILAYELSGQIALLVKYMIKGDKENRVAVFQVEESSIRDLGNGRYSAMVVDENQDKRVEKKEALTVILNLVRFLPAPVATQPTRILIDAVMDLPLARDVLEIQQDSVVSAQGKGTRAAK